MKKGIAALMALLLLSGCAAPAENTEQAAEYRMVTMDEAIELMETEDDYIILDVRTEQEYAEGHIPGSVNIPLQSIDKVASLVENKDRPLYVYCQSGFRSGQASDELRQMGYSNVKNIGGFAAYSGKVEK